jgi:hypothetical protein
MPTYHKVREDGRSLYIDANSPEDASRILREKNLALKAEKKQQAYEASPEYQPGETLESENIGTGGAILRGGLNGLVTIPTEITKSIGLGLQAAGAEELGGDFVKSADAVKERFAPDIEDLGLAAEIPKALVQFGLPAAAILRATRGANKATQILATAAGEGLVAEEDMKTFGDTYLPNPLTKTQELEFLTGQERAYTALYNKGKTGLEAAALTLGIPLALTGAGAVIRTTSNVAANVPGVKQVADGVMAVGEGFSDMVTKAEKASPLLNKALSQFRFRGDLPDETVAEMKALQATNLSHLAHKNSIAFKDLESSLGIVMKSGKENGFSQEMVIKALDDFINPMTDDFIDPKDINALSKAKSSAFKKQQDAAQTLIEMDKAMGFVTSDKLNINTSPDAIKSKLSLFRSAKNVRNTIDEYSNEILGRREYLPDGSEETIAGQIGLYNARQYRMFLSDNYEPPQAVVDKAVAVVMKASEQSGMPISKQEAVNQLSLLTRKNQFNDVSLSPKDLIDDNALKGVMRGPLRGRTLQSKEIRDFLGEYTAKRGTTEEKREGLLRGAKETLGRQSALISKGKYFSELDDYNRMLSPEAKMFVDDVPASDLLKGTNSEFVQVPDAPGYGRLAGKYVKREYFNSIEKSATSMPFENVPVVGSLYATMLGLKGASQMAKTVYNPTGQIRNATTAMGFAIANGNVPNGKTLGEAFELVSADLRQQFATQTDKKLLFEDLIKKGLVGQQSQIKELEDLIALGSDKGISILNLPAKLAKSRQNGFSARLYQSSDDIWRIFNYMTEKKKLVGMVQSSQVKNQPFNMKATTIDQMKIARANNLDPKNVDVSQLFNKFGSSTGKVDELGKPKAPTVFDEFIDAEASLITRNVVPNYSRVPKAIQSIRMLPLGNFIAYPAEIIRTSANIMQQAIKEIASNNQYIRQRGMDRLMGFGAMTTAVPAAATSLGLAMTGSSQDQLDAYKRSAAAPWDRNSNLIPVRTDKDGNILEVMNGSYTFPYDYMTRPYKAVMNAISNGERREEKLRAVLFNATWGATKEFMSPFFGESIITERVGDVFLRDGQRRIGGKLFEESDDVGDQIWAATSHVINGLVPQFSPVEFNTKEPIGRSIEYDNPLRIFRLGDLAQSVAVETGLMDPKYRVSEGGKQLDFFNELAQATSGVKTMKIDMKRSLKYKAYEARNEVAAATQDFRAIKNAYGPRPPKEILVKFQEANERKYKALRDLSIAVDDAKLLGVSTEEVGTILSKEVGGVADWRAVMNHVFVPYSPPAGVTAGAYEASETKIRNEVPLQQISDEITKSVTDTRQQFPLPAAPQPRPAPLLERAGEAVQNAPSLFNKSTQRASQFLRQQEEDKLMGGD